MNSIKLLGSEILIKEKIAGDEPKGIMHILHGGVDAAQEDKTLEFLSGRGFIALSSKIINEGKNAYFDTVTEAAYTAKHYRQKFIGLKYLLWGSGMGAAAAQGVAARFGKFLDGVILDGGVSLNAFTLEGGRLLYRINKIFKKDGSPQKPPPNFLSENLSNCGYEFFMSYLSGLRAVGAGAKDCEASKNTGILIIDSQKRGQSLAKFYKNSGFLKVECAVAEDFSHKLELAAEFLERL